MAAYTFFKEDLEDGSFVYIFGSTEGVYFNVTFDINLYSSYLETYPVLLQSGYGLGFYPNVPGSKHDSRVSETIDDIIMDFLDSQEKSAFLLYHCDFKDGRQWCRHRLFEKWNTSSKNKDYIYKHSLEVEIKIDEDNEIRHYIGFISRKDNEYNEAAIDELEQFSVDLIQVNKG